MTDGCLITLNLEVAKKLGVAEVCLSYLEGVYNLGGIKIVLNQDFIMGVSIEERDSNKPKVTCRGFLG